MDPSWGFIGNPVPRNSIRPNTGAMDPRVGSGIDPLTNRPNICDVDTPYHNIYWNECNYKAGTPEKVELEEPTAELIDTSLEGTMAEALKGLKPTLDKNDIEYDIKDALFQTITSQNETERPVQIIDIKEKMTGSDRPWWKDPVELINFKLLFEENKERTYNQTTNHYSKIALLSILGTLVLTGLFSLNIFLIIGIIGLVVIIFVRGDKPHFTSPVEKFEPLGLRTADSDKINYLPPMTPCETPAGIIDTLAPATLRKDHPNLYRSVNENFWDQANRRPIKKVCPTTTEHGEGIRFIYGDTVKRHIFY